MPAFNYAPNAALALQFSLAELAGEDLYSDSGGTITAPAEFDSFRDIYDLLCGQGSLPDTTLAAQLNVFLLAFALPGTFNAFIGEVNDLVYVTYTNGAFSLQAVSTDNPYGFSAGVVASTLIDGLHTIVAPNHWTRGNFLGSACTLNVTIGVTNGQSLEFTGGKLQGVIQRLRTHAQDSDPLTGAVATNLQAVDTDPAINFVLNENGRIEIWRPVARGTLTWDSTVLRDWLGFSGRENEVTVDCDPYGDQTKLTASYPPRGMLWLNRPIEFCEARVRGLRRQSEASDGRIESAHLLTKKGWNLRFAVTGVAETEDKSEQALDSFFAHLWRAEHFTVYQNVNEPRGAVAVRDGYSLAVCGEDNYKVGRLRLTLDTGSGDFNFELEDPQIRLRYFFEMAGWNWVE